MMFRAGKMILAMYTALPGMELDLIFFPPNINIHSVLPDMILLLLNCPIIITPSRKGNHSIPVQGNDYDTYYNVDLS